MKIRLTQSYINSIKPPDKPYWITDSGCKNLRLYVGSKSKVWYVGYRDDRGKYQNHKLGPAGEVLTVMVARDMANDFQARIARGEEPQKKPVTKINIGDFLTDIYEPWAVANRKSGQLTVNAMRSAFQCFLDTPVDELRVVDIEHWRMKRIKEGTKAATCNRRIAALKAAINWGIKRDYFETNPLQRLEKLQEHDSDAKARYLSDDERARLIAALDAREERMRQERDNHNKWLLERDMKPMPSLAGKFTDHIKPMVLFALNTGIRRGSLFSLEWGDIDFNTCAVMLRAAVSKAGKTERLPLNKTALAVIKAWKKQSVDTSDEALVFPSPVSGKILNNVKKAWAGVLRAAEIEKFRWHDMRHDFASQLVMRGVDLNTVRELMGHSDMKMTLRYAHLAPENKLRAVELLDDE